MRISDWSSDVCSSDLIDEDERTGTWAIGEGQVHHAEFEVADLDVQAALKFDVEGLGYTDFSDRKHRGHFESTYVSTPGGVLFEIGRASCRDRVCLYGWILVELVAFTYQLSITYVT